MYGIENEVLELNDCEFCGKREELNPQFASEEDYEKFEEQFLESHTEFFNTKW